MTDTREYDYELPPELIAQFPLPQRSDARLMLVKRNEQAIEHLHVRDLPELLGPKDMLVVNETRVIPARLVGYRKRTGGRWQGLFLSANEQGVWRLLGKTRGKLLPGEIVVVQDRQFHDSLELTMLTNLGGGEWAARVDQPGSASEILERIGRVPLPGYIRGGEMVDADLATYQTVFANKPGAVAAPTAGLHLTESLLRNIEQRGTRICRITLHVGIGTFRPITAESLDEHVMHSEWASIDAGAAEQLARHRSGGGRIIAVGTTVVRTLESAAPDGEFRAWQGETRLFIRPPYSFRAVDALMTNFHLPRSTLLVLVRTFGGDALMRRAYEEAIRERYRFYSYGDAMLIV